MAQSLAMGSLGVLVVHHGQALAGGKSRRHQKEAVKKSSCRGGPCGRPARAGATIPRLRDHGAKKRKGQQLRFLCALFAFATLREMHLLVKKLFHSFKAVAAAAALPRRFAQVLRGVRQRPHFAYSGAQPLGPSKQRSNFHYGPEVGDGRRLEYFGNLELSHNLTPALPLDTRYEAKALDRLTKICDTLSRSFLRLWVET